MIQTAHAAGPGNPGRGGRWHRGRHGLGLGGAVLAAALLLAACGGPSASHSTATTSAGAKVHGGTVTIALPAGEIPNYIFPLMPGADFTGANLVYFTYLLYRPLYWFGKNGQPVFNERLSLAYPPVWSNSGRTVTVKLKDYRWSNGARLTSTDVAFWQHLVTAEKDNWAASAPGGYPVNVRSVTVVNPTTITFHLNRSYNHMWYLYNELSQITPLPAAWDVTGAGAAPGSGGCATTMSRCGAVYGFLAHQATDIRGYVSNPLWHVVDGPWRLKEFQTSGYLVMVPNRAYSGPVKPTISKLVELPFTSDSAEFNAVLAGHTVDYGYLPFTDLAQKARAIAAGYEIAPWPNWGIGYMMLNFNNPTAGPLLKQLYVRQALQHLVDQQGVIRTYYGGYAYPDYGPVPLGPPNPYTSSYERSNPYPFSVRAAKDLLASHGWTTEHGVAVCTSPGSGAGKCGSGISGGTKLQFNVGYSSGVPELESFMETYKSDAAQAGIELHLTSSLVTQLIANSAPCRPGPKCSWQITNIGGNTWGFLPDFEPTGEEIFATGAGSNFGNYSNPTNDANIVATNVAPPSQSKAAMNRYQNYLAKQIPVIWQPAEFNQISLIKRNLHGITPQAPVGGLTPESWYYTR